MGKHSALNVTVEDRRRKAPSPAKIEIGNDESEKEVTRQRRFEQNDEGMVHGRRDEQKIAVRRLPKKKSKTEMTATSLLMRVQHALQDTTLGLIHAFESSLCKTRHYGLYF